MNSTRRMLIAAALFLSVGLAVACTEDPTAPSPEVDAAVTSTQSPGLLRCYPQPYSVSGALIGPGGGVIVVGRHKLIIPQGALSKRVLITAEAPSDTINSVRFGPEGLTFNDGARPKLKLDYSNCPGAKYVNKKIVYTDDSLRTLEALPTLDDPANSDVMTILRHFSRYAIDY